MRRRLLVLPLVLVSLGLSSCFAVTNLDRFHTSTGSDAPFMDLKFTFRGSPHLTALFELRIIDANNLIQARGFYDPMGAADTTVNFPRAIPRVNGPYRLDFYADVDMSGGWDGLDTGPNHDHGWRIQPLVDSAPGADPNDSVIEILYDHNLSFTELNDNPPGTHNPAKEPGSPAKLHMKNLGELAGKFVEARVCDATTGHCSGLYRWPSVNVPSADVTIPGIIDPELGYEVTIYADANGNGTYDDPAVAGGDYGWKMAAPSSAQGLEITFDPLAQPNRNVSVGPP